MAAQARLLTASPHRAETEGRPLENRHRCRRGLCHRGGLFRQRDQCRGAICNRSPGPAISSTPSRPIPTASLEGATIQDLGRKKLKNIDDPVQVYRAYLPAYELFMETSRADLKTPPRLLKHLKKPTLRLEPFRSLNPRGEEPPLCRRPGRRGATDPIASQQLDPCRRPDRIDCRQITTMCCPGRSRAADPILRIMARLTSTSDGLTMWAERYECDLESSFDVQDQISREIVAALQLALTEGEQAQLVRRGTKSGKAWDLFQRAHDIERQFTREGHEKAKDFYEQALALDAEYLSALVALAFCHLDEVRLGWSKDEHEFARSRQCAVRSGDSLGDPQCRRAGAEGVSWVLPEALGRSACQNAGSRAGRAAKSGDHRLSRRALRPDGRLPRRHRRLHARFVAERAFARLDTRQYGSVASGTRQ